MNSQFLKRAASIVVSGLMITSLLVGCGPKDEPITNVEPSASVEPSKDPGGDTPKELKGEFTFWHFNKDEGPLLAKAFEDKYPGVKINVQITADSDMAYQNKVTAALRAGKGMPDLYAVESAYVKRFVNMPGGFEDLSAAPYNAEELTSKMISYTIDIGRSDDGKIRGLSHQGTPGGIGYKRDIATKYLGTDDPAAISEMLSSPEKMIETAKLLKEKSGGKARLVPGTDELRKIYLGGRSEGWIKDGKLNIDPKMMEYVDLQKQLRDLGQDAGMQAWTPAWSAAIADETSFMFAIPTWGIPYIIAANDTENKETGRWGVANPPFSYSWGGTWYGLYSGADQEKKQLAWEFIKFICTDTAFQESWAKSSGDFISNTEVIEKLANDATFESKTVKQNPYVIFKDAIPKINGKILNQYDDSIEIAFRDAMETYFSGKKSKDDAMKDFKAKVKSNIKDIIVE